MTDVPAGYSRTEFGTLPNSWRIRPVGSMGDVLAGKALAKNRPGRLRPYLRTKNIFDGHVDLADVPSMPMTNAEFSRYRLRHGDVLLNEGQSLELVGRCSLYKDEYRAPCAIQNQLVRFRAREDVSAAFAAHLFRHCQRSGVFSRIALQTTSVAHLGVTRFKRLLLPWPGQTKEQKRIAGALSDADELIVALGKMISKKQAMKQAAMQQLLSAQRRLPGFRENWKTKRLRDILTFLPSTGNPRADLTENGDVEYIHYGDVHAHTQPVLNCAGFDLPRIDKRCIGNAAPLQDGDLVMVDASEDLAGVGKSIEVQGISEQTVVSGLHTILCRGHRNDWATGFKAYLQFSPAFKHALMRVTAGSSVYAISKRQLAGVEIQLPSLSEQEAMVSVLSDMDAEIAALEQRRAKMRHVKRGMMQQLLTGRVRLGNPT